MTNSLTSSQTFEALNLPTVPDTWLENLDNAEVDRLEADVNGHTGGHPQQIDEHIDQILLTLIEEPTPEIVHQVYEIEPIAPPNVSLINKSIISKLGTCDIDAYSITPSIANTIFHDIFDFSKCKTLQPTIEFPIHPIKANGLSYISKDGRLYATNRGLDDKQISFGLANFTTQHYPGAKLAVYVSIPGVHQKIESCHNCAKKYSSEFMEIYYKSDRQRTVLKMNEFNAITCPIVNAIGADNNRIYQIKFNCFTSHAKRVKNTDVVQLNFVILHNGGVIWKESLPLEVSANPGRDSGVFKGSATKRKVSVEYSKDEKQPINATNLLTPVMIKSLIGSKMPLQMSAAKKTKFYEDMNTRIVGMINHVCMTELDLLHNQLT